MATSATFRNMTGAAAHKAFQVEEPEAEAPWEPALQSQARRYKRQKMGHVKRIINEPTGGVAIAPTIAPL